MVKFVHLTINGRQVCNSINRFRHSAALLEFMTEPNQCPRCAAKLAVIQAEAYRNAAKES